MHVKFVADYFFKFRIDSSRINSNSFKTKPEKERQNCRTKVSISCPNIFAFLLFCFFAFLNCFAVVVSSLVLFRYSTCTLAAGSSRHLEQIYKIAKNLKIVYSHKKVFAGVCPHTYASLNLRDLFVA